MLIEVFPVKQSRFQNHLHRVHFGNASHLATASPRLMLWLRVPCASLGNISFVDIVVFFLARLAQKKSCSSKGVELYRYSSPVNQFIQHVCLFKAHIDGIRCVSSTIPYSFRPRPFVSKSVRQQEIFHFASDLSNVNMKYSALCKHATRNVLPFCPAADRLIKLFSRTLYVLPTSSA